MSKRFIPVRGPEDKLNNMGFNDGYVYFCTDTGHIYTDYYEGGEVGGAKVERQLLGGSGAGGGEGNGNIYYANRTLTDEEKLEEQVIFPLDTIEGGEYPEVDGLMFNTGDSSFYRVLKISRVDKTVTCQRLTVAGGSGGGSTSTLAEDIDLVIEDLETPNLINGYSQQVYFTATSALNNKGNEIDKKITVNWSLAYTEDNGANYTTYKTGVFQVNSGERSSLEFGNYAKESATSRLTLKVSQTNHSSTKENSVVFSMSKLELKSASDFNNISYFDPSKITLRCSVYGDMEKRLEYYFDNDTTPIYTVDLSENSTVAQAFNVSQYVSNISNGAHKVWIRLFQLVNGQKGIEVEPLIFEIGVFDEVDSTTAPIIWLGDYQEQYYSYDTIQIPFRVVDPANTSSTEVHFKRNGIELSYSPKTITDNSAFSIFEIANPELNVVNHYTISCGEGERETVRKIEFTVTQDPNRTDFGVQREQLLTYSLNTVGSGRSNSESISKRTTLVNEVEGEDACAATFTNFNWYNNGWTQDDEQRTCLRISNGASLSIPIGPMTFADSSSDTRKSHTIELMFKIRNVQDYSNLIRTVTRYKGDDALYAKFYNESTGQFNYTNYTNYDAFLAWYLKNNYVEYQDPDTGEVRAMDYDDLEFNNIAKQISLNNVVCGYYSGDTKSVVGLCLGPQDAFFSNGTDTVNISYVENQIVTLSAVYKYDQVTSQNLLQIYLNGVLTGVTTNSLSDPFVINSDSIVINSQYCDIDLYKIRVYRTNLTVNDIVMNYAADFGDVNIYDQNKLAEENTAINEFQFKYENMIKYNENHPDEPLMPYVIFDTTDNSDNMLPYSKKVSQNIKFEFVNTPLEMYYTKGKLEELAKADGLWTDGSSAEEKAEAVKEYYIHHCPSFYSDNSVASVQGTSSEFYPRRNYKVKTKQKGSDGTKRVNIFLNRGPFKEAYEADQLGMTQKPYKLCTSAFLDTSLTYYYDSNGEQEVTFSEDVPYEKNKYYIVNTSYVAPGKEATRQSDGWYFNNYTCPTDRWTMKIDYMESSGTYNMGFANMVATAYSKHPLDDYNDAGAFEVLDASKSQEVEATVYEEGVTYSYYNHKGNVKTTNGEEDNIPPLTEEDFAKGPYFVYKELMESDPSTYTKLKVIGESDTEHYNKWFIRENGYSDLTVKNTEDYRTSVRGFRVLAFHKKTNPNDPENPIYQFIGIYNMLLDKGSDACYGFDLETTTGKSPVAKFVDRKSMEDVTECWEFQNNSRTYCSYRDPKDRKDLRFDVFNDDGSRMLNAVKSGPLVADSFEYRYHTDEDFLDYIMEPSGTFSEGGIDYTLGSDITVGQEDRVERFLEDSKNWEKAVAWVWSTCTEKVVAQGTYSAVDVGNEVFNSSSHYEYVNNPDYDENDEDSLQFIYQLATEYVPGNIYYNKVITDGKTTYEVAHIGEYLFNDIKDNLYIGSTSVSGEVSYAPVTSSDVFDSSTAYYMLIEYNDEELEEHADRLVELCTAEEFDENETYYTYDGDKKCGEAVNKIELTAETYEPNKYYTGITVTYGKRSYKYDTQEYRGDKFLYELEDHFDLEYMATYFVMTEVFECYDSRGKNCMMATWGPHKKGGDYIWYPIFYDIDTQLGINNTGIPSFEYNVDATENGNYSTSDSVLWNNFYKYFKNSYIVPKYKHVRGTNTDVFTKLDNPPLKSIDRIEQWYLTDYNVTKNLADLGTRPLVAINLDEYYKYITITNSAGLADGSTGKANSEGVYDIDTNGTYFYALQGRRDLSRVQFLTNRIEYVDSWLNQGNYQRGGNNRIRGRIAANNSSKTSDKWVETATAPYYDANGNKNHLFDAEYWMTLTPAHSSYVTLGDDNEAYPSRKYDGINPLKFNIDSIESGVRTSANYPEQLLYVYGINQMQDLGDMSNLYWQEFEISGDASKLTSLKLGYDGLDEEGNQWKNNNVNQFSIPAAAVTGSTGMPLLKEVNMCNIQFNASTATLDLTSCEKLENFRATGSNFNNIKFAAGVALNTLYLPSTINNFELIEANLLKNIITEDEYEYPTRNSEGNLIAKPGLYIQGFFDGASNAGTTNIATMSIQGSGLGYDSYRLLEQYYKMRSKQNNTSQITMTGVEWSPYVQVSIDDEYDVENSNLYYADDGHYGLEPFIYTTYESWNVRVTNGEIFKLNTEITATQINWITSLDMFKEMADNSKYIKNSSVTIPDIAGTIYINNTDAIDETELRNYYQVKYPNLQIFCANVNKGYTARFVVMDESEGNDGFYTLIGSMTLESGETWFKNPVDVYGDVSKYKENHDFYGWALTNSESADIIVNVDKSINTWDSQSLVTDQYTYIFYAICPIHKWDVKYYYKDGTLIENIPTAHNTYAQMSNEIPYQDDSNLDLEYTYQFLGYSRTADSNTIVDLESYLVTENTAFYAVFADEPISVYDNIHPEYFTPSVIDVSTIYGEEDNVANQSSSYNIREVKNASGTVTAGAGIVLALQKKVKGKLAVPATYTVGDYTYRVMAVDATFGAPGNDSANQNTYWEYGDEAKYKNGTLVCSKCYGENLTHVFFEKNSDGSCNIRYFAPHAFSGNFNLVWVEFPKGLRVIKEFAFFMPDAMDVSCKKPKFKNVNVGGTIYRINGNAFSFSFAHENSLDTLILGSEVSYCEAGAIKLAGNLFGLASETYSLGVTHVIIGDANNKSKLATYSGTYSMTNGVCISGWQYNTNASIEWYTNFSSGVNDSIFENFANITHL